MQIDQEADDNDQISEFDKILSRIFTELEDIEDSRTEEILN